MSKRSGKRKNTAEEALQRVKDLTEKHSSQKAAKKKRKPVRFEITTDPVTGLRDFKGTYDPSKRSRCQGMFIYYHRDFFQKIKPTNVWKIYFKLIY